VRKNVQIFLHKHLVDEKKYLPRILATIVNLPNIAGALNILENVGHNSEPRH